MTTTPPSTPSLASMKAARAIAKQLARQVPRVTSETERELAMLIDQETGLPGLIEVIDRTERYMESKGFHDGIGVPATEADLCGRLRSALIGAGVYP